MEDLVKVCAVCVDGPEKRLVGEPAGRRSRKEEAENAETPGQGGVLLRARPIYPPVSGGIITYGFERRNCTGDGPNPWILFGGEAKGVISGSTTPFLPGRCPFSSGDGPPRAGYG